MIKIIAIVGPTASGKSDLAIEFARAFHGEIVSVDSRQIYKGLDLGTGKVTKREQRMARHHMLDITNPGKTYSIAQFQKKANALIDRIHRARKLPILVGGSHLYMRSLLYGYHIPATKPDRTYRNAVEKKSTPALLTILKKVDEPYYAIVDRNNRRRIIRALEVYRATGKRFSSLTGQMTEHYNALLIGIDMPRALLYNRIDARVESRTKKGMIKEIERLIERGVSKKWLTSIGLEYRFITHYLQGDRTKESRAQCLQKLKYATHDFARRQLVWYRKEKNIQWIKNTKQALSLAGKFLTSRS